MEDFVGQIVEKLRFMKINKIVSIDNDWNNQQSINFDEDINNLVDRIHPENEEIILKKISNKGYITVKDVYEANDMDIISIIERDIERKNVLPIAISKLNDVLKKIEKYGIEIERESTYSVEKLKQYKENCLFILDKEMDEDNKDIIKLTVPKILDDANSEGFNHLIIIYSSNIGNEYNNNKDKLQYVKQNIDSEDKSNIYIYKLFAIKKSEEIFEATLNEKISDCIYGDALYHYMQIEKIKSSKIYNKICEINNEEITKVTNDTAIEGNNISNSIRIIQNALRREIENQNFCDELDVIEKLNFYQKNKLDKFVKENAHLNSNSKYNAYRKDKNKEIIQRIADSKISMWEIIDYSINKKYEDVLTGDIYKITLNLESKEVYAIVIQNLCDCILRYKNIDKVDRNSKNGFMRILIFEKKEINPNDLPNIFDDENIIYPVKEKEIFYLQNTKNEKYFPQFILDMCTLNSNGVYLKDYDDEIIKKYKNYYFEKYFEMEDVNKQKKLINDDTSDAICEWNKIIKDFAERDKIILPDEIKKDKDGNFLVTRLGRLNYEIILRIYQKNFFEFLDATGVDDTLKKKRKDILISNEKIIAPKS